MEIMIVCGLLVFIGFLWGRVSAREKREKEERATYEIDRLITSLRMEKELKPWTKYEINRCEEVLKNYNEKQDKNIRLQMG